MSVLYRKYRPKAWKDVVGQESIVSVLSNEVKLGTMAHAYLFAGSRGTGKTSVARIFASELGTSASDIYEIDAASQNGVDEIRALNEAVHTLPFESKYKVYILDEAHMLSKGAWNAFLKTLEEPPAHVIFILATTELEKVPDTVQSRCQAFVFKRPNQKILREFALHISKEEGRKLDPESAELVSLLGDGSFRDTAGILDKIFSSSQEKQVSREEVERVTGAPRAGLVRDVLASIVEHDLKRGMQALAMARESNADMKIFARLILENLRYLFLIRLKAGLDDYILGETSEDDFNFMKDLAGKADKSLTADILLKFIDAAEASGRSTIPELPLEIALSESINP
ncbi:DNA polymerase III subunit gamma/tau [Candidatus Parcubacteria bacterium]|nr:DNA polymerase III subunit gamma/tau [Candidatus Parcubacteria bacterium]